MYVLYNRTRPTACHASLLLAVYTPRRHVLISSTGVRLHTASHQAQCPSPFGLRAARWAQPQLCSGSTKIGYPSFFIFLTYHYCVHEYHPRLFTSMPAPSDRSRRQQHRCAVTMTCARRPTVVPAVRSRDYFQQAKLICNYPYESLQHHIFLGKTNKHIFSLQITIGYLRTCTCGHAGMQRTGHNASFGGPFKCKI